MSGSNQLELQGIRSNGDRLRPDDWIERVSSMLAGFVSEQHLPYPESLQPCVIGGEHCLVVARDLQDSDPAAYGFIVAFARSHQLHIQPDRRHGSRALKHTGKQLKQGG